jgi:hypothetical protein
MSKSLRWVIAVVAGFAVGSVVNGGLVLLGGSLIPPPPGADTSTVEGTRAAMALMQPRHFIFPFLAHALGTLAGVLIAAMLSPVGTRGPALVVGALFLLGGVAAAAMFPAPGWFKALDLILAYGPMTWLGLWFARRLRPPGAADAA